MPKTVLTQSSISADVPMHPDTKPLEDRRVVLGVTGSIAAYKAAYLASRLHQLGAHVNVVMTESALEFVGPATFAAITHLPVSTSLWQRSSESNVDHVELGIRADCVVIAPATANTIAKIALGITDDALTATVLASDAPIVVAPAMDADMFASHQTQDNLSVLRDAGATIVGPESGHLASGLVGAGRMSDPDDIADETRYAIGKNRGDFAGRSVVVTAGGTVEPIDPVRVITNRSTGKMGYAVAEAARDRGATVTLISTPTALRRPAGMNVVGVETVNQMRDATLPASCNADLLVMAAAVSDFRVTNPETAKIKKNDKDRLTLEFETISDWMPDAVGERLVKVAFAAETGDAAKKAASKVTSKGAIFTVANDISELGSGFGYDTNRVDVVTADGSIEPLPRMSKYAVAHAILDRALPHLRQLSKSEMAEKS